VVVATVSDVLAVWGALTGTLATAIGLFAYLRDRPKLVTLAGEVTGSSISVKVVNQGRQPESLLALGVAMHPSGVSERLRRVLRRGDRIEAWGDVREPIVLEPGHVRTESIDFVLMLNDERLWTVRTFALDTRGRRARGPKTFIHPSKLVPDEPRIL
jgi:hypothetical protein